MEMNFSCWQISLVGAVVGAQVSGACAAAETVIDWLAPLESGLDCVPVFDGGFAGLPAEKHDFVVHPAREVEQPSVQVFDLNANFINFLNGFACALDMLFQFGASGGDFGDVHHHAAGDVDAAGK